MSHNSLVTSTTQLPRLVTVETLWVNYCQVSTGPVTTFALVVNACHSQIDNLALFVDRIAKAFPNLRFLSMMGTAACPNFLNGGTRAQYVDYRLFVMTRLPRLECLEDEPVTAEQRAHAAQKYGAPVEKPSLESVLGRKKEKLGKKKGAYTRWLRFAAAQSPPCSVAVAEVRSDNVGRQRRRRARASVRASRGARNSGPVEERLGGVDDGRRGPRLLARLRAVGGGRTSCWSPTMKSARIVEGCS